MRIIDLTRTIQAEMPVYPGDPEVQFRRAADYGEAGFRVSTLELGTHAGTHIDAPAHFLPGAPTIDLLSPGVLVGPARVVDMQEGNAAFTAGERIVVRSGWGQRWGSADYYSGFPGLPAAFAERLAAAPVGLVALETPSLHPEPEEDARLHRLLLGRGVVIVENLANVDLLPDQFLLAALPLPLVGLDGSPARVVAAARDGSPDDPVWFQ